MIEQQHSYSPDWRCIAEMQKRFRDNGRVLGSLNVCRLSINFGPILRHFFGVKRIFGSSGYYCWVSVLCHLSTSTLFPPRWSMDGVWMEYRGTHIRSLQNLPHGSLFLLFFSYLILFLAFPRVSTRLEFSEYACAWTCSDHCRTMCVILLVVVILHNSCFTQPSANCLDQVHLDLLE